MGGLVNVRRGTQRADDVHPLQWWVLSESARREAAASWKTQSGEILRANNRRSTPREPLESMPPSTTTIPAEMSACVTKFIVSDDQSNSTTTYNHDRNGRTLILADNRSAASASNLHNEPAATIPWWDENFDMTLQPVQQNPNTADSITIDILPALVHESSDDGICDDQTGDRGNSIRVVGGGLREHGQISYKPLRSGQIDGY